jgi:hypothetical protein
MISLLAEPSQFPAIFLEKTRGDGPEAWGFAAATGVLGALVLLLASPAGHAGERLTAHRRPFRSMEFVEAATFKKRPPLVEGAGYAERS